MSGTEFSKDSSKVDPQKRFGHAGALLNGQDNYYEKTLDKQLRNSAPLLARSYIASSTLIDKSYSSQLLKKDRPEDYEKFSVIAGKEKPIEVLAINLSKALENKLGQDFSSLSGIDKIQEGNKVLKDISARGIATFDYTHEYVLDSDPDKNRQSEQLLIHSINAPTKNNAFNEPGFKGNVESAYKFMAYFVEEGLITMKDIEQEKSFNPYFTECVKKHLPENMKGADTEITK